MRSLSIELKFGIGRCLKDCSHDAIAPAIDLSQLVGCMGFGVPSCKYFILNPTQPIFGIEKCQSVSHYVNKS